MDQSLTVDAICSGIAGRFPEFPVRLDSLRSTFDPAPYALVWQLCRLYILSEVL